MSWWLREDLARFWLKPGQPPDPFGAAVSQTGAVFREKEGRRTLRFESDGRAYFLKLHQGIGWGEILKNLAQGRLPVLGARNEFNAIRALERISIDTMSIAGFGEQGWNPAHQLSFLVTDELVGVTSLEDVCRTWPAEPPSYAIRRCLIERVAGIARDMHGTGINHRDFYLCHFMLDTRETLTDENIAVLPLYLMDLHRAQQRRSVPRRWLIKDLGALYYSALDIGLSRRDVLYFIRHYAGTLPRHALRNDRSFWLAVRERAGQIYRRDFGREPQWPL